MLSTAVYRCAIGIAPRTRFKDITESDTFFPSTESIAKHVAMWRWSK